MKALTVRQPWAAAIASGEKTIENRPRRLHRLPLRLAIHAGTRPDDSAAIRPSGANRTRQIVAVVTVESCHRPGVDCEDACRRWGDLDASWHWVLRDVIPVAPGFAARGQLGIWECPYSEAQMT